MPCSLCDDTGWRPVERDGVRRVERCECWREALVGRLLNAARIPGRYAHCDLAGFHTNTDSQSLAVRACRRLLDEWAADRKGLFFVGNPGVGKTHLAVATLREFITRNHLRAIFYDVRELLKEIRATYNPESQTTEIDLIHSVMTAELLVLDDIGAERATEWVGETLNLIVNDRYNDRKLTIFTSNYPIKDDDTDPESLPVRLGFRMWSRIHEMCSFVHIDGHDFRELGPDATPEMIAKLDRQGSLSHRLHPTRKGGKAMAKAQLKPQKELGWSGGKAGT